VARIGRLGCVLLVSATLAGGCGRGPSREVAADAPVPRPAAAAAAPARPAPPANFVVGDTVTMGGGSVAVEAVEPDVQAGRLFSPPAGRQYFAVQVRGCAGSKEDGVAFRPEFFTLQLADRTVHEAGLGMKKPELIGATVPPGSCLGGWVTFTIPEDGQPISVIYDGSQPVKWAVPPPVKPGRG
jgi:uncharacterized protein DUF4352